MLALGVFSSLATFSPARIEYGALVDRERFASEGGTQLRDALSAVGIVQVDGIPGYARARQPRRSLSAHG